MYPVFIYALNCPLTGHPRYVGKTSNPKTRLCQHVSDSRTETNHRACWIRSLLAQNLRPEFEILAQVSRLTWAQDEIDYIAAFRSLGYDLVNGTDGGEDPPSWAGKKHTPETIAKLSAAHSGNKNPMFGKPSPELGKKRPAVSGKNHFMFGKKLPDETCRKISATKRKNYLWQAQTALCSLLRTRSHQ